MSTSFYPLYYIRKIEGVLASIDLMMYHINEIPDAKQELNVLDELKRSLSKKLDKLQLVSKNDKK